jgi:nucleotide-binding universal stress UspA family protein
MSQTIGPGFALIDSVLHPTDFSEASRVAFHHALKAALLARSSLTLLNVSTSKTAKWSDFPGVRETLERWGALPSGSLKTDVGKLGIDARKIVADHDEPVAAVVRYLQNHPTDLIVLATSQRDGRVRWLGKSVAEPVTRKSGEMTLLIPGDTEGFVRAGDGSIKLSKILIPIAQSPPPLPAVKLAARFALKMQSPAGTFVLMHAGTTNTMPACSCPDVPGWTWQKDLRNGDVIEGIVNAAKEHEADLIVMSTDGRNGFLDGIRGSHSERVLRHGGTPLLTIPVGSRISRFLA